MMQAIYEQVLQLVEQLTPAERLRLVAHLQREEGHMPLSKAERLALWEAAKITSPIGPEFSLSREDWYDDER